MREGLTDEELGRLGYAVEDGRLEPQEAEELANHPEKARAWLDAHDEEPDVDEEDTDPTKPDDPY